MMWVEAYLAVVEQVLILLVPVLFALSVYSWALVWRYRKRRVRLPLILALICTIVGVGATWLSYTVLFRSRVGPVPTEFLAVTATVILLMATVPFLSVGYLAYLEITDTGSRYRRRRDDRL